MFAPLTLRAPSRPLSKLLAVAFFLFFFFFISEKQTQGQTPPQGSIVRGTLQIKRGMSLSEMLLSGQMFMTMPTPQTAGSGMDACDFDLFIGTPYGNRRVIQRFLTGSGLPGTGRGAILDMYLDTASVLLYQKTGAGWGTPISLKGANGTNGTNGMNGINGITPTFTYGTTTTLSAGSPASASITGTSPNYVLNLGLPVGGTGGTGANGTAATVTVGTTTTLAVSATPTVTNTGTANAAVFAFGLPAGAGTLIRNVQGVAVPAIALGVLGVPGTGQVTVTFATPFADANYIAHPSFRKTTNGLNVTLSLSAYVRSQTASSVTFDVTAANVALLGGNAVMDVTAIHNP